MVLWEYTIISHLKHLRKSDTLYVGSKDGLAGPNHYLCSQFIYLVGLGILPWVVLG